MGIRIVLVSHLGLASGMKQAVEFIVGEQTNFFAYELDNDGIETFKQKMSELTAIGEDATIIVSDIPAGSPGATAYSTLANQHNVHLLSGMNLPLIIELVLYRDIKDLTTLITESLESGRNSLQNYTTIDSEEDEDDDF